MKLSQSPAFRVGLSISIATGLYGVSFGALSVASGLDFWQTMALSGALAGAALGDPKQWGLDGAAVAAFLGLLWPRLKGREPVAIAVVCALATVLAVPLVPSGVPILVAALVAAVIGWFSHGRRDEGLEPDVDPYAAEHDAGRRAARTAEEAG